MSSYAVELTDVLVASITTVGVVITALLGFLGSEARKGRKALGVSEGRTLMGVLESIAASVGEQAAHNKVQDERLQTIETDVHSISGVIETIDGRVLTLEELAMRRRDENEAARQGWIDRRAQG